MGDHSVKVKQYPQCDVCKIEGITPPREAHYDGVLVAYPGSHWGYMCEEHFKSHGAGKTGLGVAQRLVKE